MATKNSSAKFDDDAQYRVRLADRVEVLGLTLVPGQEIILRGDVVKSIQEKVEHAEPL